jgi:hypothetical protein
MFPNQGVNNQNIPLINSDPKLFPIQQNNATAKPKTDSSIPKEIKQATVKIYAPNTEHMNFIDAMALHVYCTVSKAFVDFEYRNKCFIDPNITIKEAGTDLKPIENELKLHQQLINDLKSRQAQTNQFTQASTSAPVIITKYISSGIKGAKGEAGRGIASTTMNGNGSLTFTYTDGTSLTTASPFGLLTNSPFILLGHNNEIYSVNGYVIGATNTVAVNATNSYIYGSNIINSISNSVQLGTNDTSKVFIGADGFVGIASSTNGGARTTRLVDEQLRVGGRVRAQGFDVDSGADLAEVFPKDDADLQPGNIVQFSDISHKWSTGGVGATAGEYDLNGVVKASKADLAIGVIATNPGVLLGVTDQGGVPVAFSGRVPVKVTSENGTIRKGDRVTLSNTEFGVGAKLNSAGISVGIALSDDIGKGTVLMLVKNETITGEVAGASTTNVTNPVSPDRSSNEQETSKKDLCIEEVCVNKSLLQKIINFLNSIPNTSNE